MELGRGVCRAPFCVILGEGLQTLVAEEFDQVGDAAGATPLVS